MIEPVQAIRLDADDGGLTSFYTHRSAIFNLLGNRGIHLVNKKKGGTGQGHQGAHHSSDGDPLLKDQAGKGYQEEW